MRKGLEPTSEELAVIARRRARAREIARRLVESADPEEDASVVAAAMSDPDALPMTDEELSRMRPAHEVHPELVARLIRRGRPKLAAPKRQVTLRIDAEVLDHFKASGTGWQTAINDVLRKAVGKRERRARPEKAKAERKAS